MPTVAINGLGQFGVIQDRLAHELPPNAWSDGNNVRARNGFMEKCLGFGTVFGTPTVAPYNVGSAAAGTAYYWVYAGLAQVYAYDFSTHTLITRLSGAYNATADNNWQISNFQGLTLLNNGVDVPQIWSPVSLAQRLVDLPNWNAAHTAMSVRPYRQFMVALDVTKSGTRYPQMVKWSHSAAAGAVPSSWDEADATKDAGEYDLADTVGFCVDGATMRDTYVIYKEDAVWGMQYVGGPKVMRFFKIFDGLGALSRRCAVEFFNGRHAVLGVGDIYTHDGQNKQSIVDGRLRRWFFNQMEPDYFQRAFTVVNQDYSEVWFCAPTAGNTSCNIALVWNWNDNTVTVRELPNIHGAAAGIVGNSGSDVWDSDSGAWDSDATFWNARTYNPSRNRLLVARPSTANLLLGDDTNKIDTSLMTSYVERTGLGVPFRADKPPDTGSMKFLSGVWPRIEGTVGGVVKVYVGQQQRSGDSPTYQSPVDFTIGTTKHIPCRLTGRMFCLKFESTTDVDWRLHSYDLDVKQVGRF